MTATKMVVSSPRSRTRGRAVLRALRHGLLSALLWAGWAGCGGSSPATQGQESGASAEAAPPPPRFPRRLNADAAYADFTRNVGALAANADLSAEGACMLQLGPAGYSITGELAPAIYPVPQAPADLDARLPAVTGVNILTPFGRYGTGHSALSLASLTYLPPSPRAVALIVTDRGIHLRGARSAPQDSAPVADGLSAQEAQVVLTATDDLNVYVAAEPTVPLARVWELLESLEQRTHRVALAVALSPAATLKRKDAGSIADLCPEGLPPRTGDAGRLSRASIHASLGPLTERASQCLSAADARGAAGGRVVVALRVKGDGSVDQACAKENETADRALASCVVALSKQLSFPAPNPAGSVDIELPLRLRGDYPPPGARLTCTAEPEAPSKP